jgi:hypothetical protein
MMASLAWALVRDAPSPKETELDQYTRQEYGGPNAAWLLAQEVGRNAVVERSPEDGVSEGLFRRITQAIVAFF